ncbi:MAG: OsmC family peroxiredoxin [Balneolaceae bacterium]|jgi:osmotically inducible protein OsmC|nr:MAG: OsmC family peroxiredoxin [Balneolaceae bacterium]
MKRTAEAVWKGSGLEGSGTLTTPKSGVFDKQPYSLKLRFENEDGKLGTNPEELIAAAHAGCYAMALSVGLQKAGYTADTLDATSVINLDKDGEGWSITKSELTLKAVVPDISEEEFEKIANGAKAGCPVSKVLNCEITLDYTLNA